MTHRRCLISIQPSMCFSIVYFFLYLSSYLLGPTFEKSNSWWSQASLHLCLLCLCLLNSLPTPLYSGGCVFFDGEGVKVSGKWEIPVNGEIQEITGSFSYPCITTVLLGSFQIVWSLLADGSYMQQFIMCSNIYMQTCALAVLYILMKPSRASSRRLL